jgi:hypothetical protein
MSKQITIRQIETAQRELNNAVSDVIGAWRTHEPYPSWELEEEWKVANPSPRGNHARLEGEVRTAAKAKADELMLKLKLGEVQPENIYSELKTVLDELHERKLSYLKVQP